jgi:two-component system phosphate regulon sensor histidine kinase PhoR
VNTDTRSFQASRNFQWLFLALAAAALVFGRSFARGWPYGIVLIAGAVLNAAAYLVPLEKLTARRSSYALTAQLVVQLTVISLAIGYSGGTESPLYAFLLVALLIPAVSSDLLRTGIYSAYSIAAFLLSSTFLASDFGGASQAFIKIALLAAVPVGLNLILANYRRRLRDSETFSTLYRIGRSLGESLDLKQVLNHLLVEVDSIFRTDISSVRLLDPGTNTLVVKASGADTEEVAQDQIEIKIGEGFIGWVGKSGEPFISSDISKDPRFATFPRARKKVFSAIAAPVKISERTVGVISCASSRRKRFSADDLDLLISVASLAAEAIERAELYQQLLSRGEAVIEGMLDGLLVVDRESRVVLTNRTSREMLGARPGANEPLEDLSKGRVAEWKRLCREIDNQIIDMPDRPPSPFSFELNIIAGEAAGRVLSARVSPVTGQWSNIIGAVVLLQDVTDKIRLSGELAVEKAKLETVLESIVVGVIAINDAGEVLIANSSLFNMLGMARPWWWLGALLEDAVPEPALVRIIKKAADSDVPVYNESVTLSSGRYVEVSCAPTEELSSGTAGTVAVVHDITGIHRVEQSKTDFVSMVSHELRTPLTSIKAYVDTLQRQDVTFDDETRSSFIAVISRETERMTRLINDILDLSRIEAGRLELRPTFVDLSELARKVVARMESQTAGHEIVLDLPEAIERVLAEPEKVEQVMLNLIGNALKYSPDGGAIEISVRRLKEKAVVSVTDHGMGIDGDQLPYIFDKYHRGGKASGEGIRGSGLGLFVTKSIVEAHGGRIWAESKEGKGTTVLFTMPLAAEAGQGGEVTATGDESA